MWGLVLLVVVGSTIWVGLDARRRDFGNGMGAPGWVVACVLLWIVAFPLYLAKRGKAPLKTGEATASGAATPHAMHRECPHCKEQMRRDASVCPHCRNPSVAWRWHEGRWWRNEDEGAWEWLDERAATWQRVDA